jgi:hypothetical protein
MALTGKMYGQALLKALAKEIGYTADTIKVMLCTNAYTPNQDTHIYKSSVTDEIASGGGYTTGGQALANKSLTYTAGTNTIVLDADDTNWTNSSLTARFAVIYDDTPATDATKPLLAYIDLGKDYTSSNGDFKLVWNANGIITITTT